MAEPEAYVAPPEESLREVMDLLAELDRTAKDARLGYIRHRTATNAVTKVLPAIRELITSAMDEITAGEREEDHAEERHSESYTEPCEHLEVITICARCLEQTGTWGP